MSSRRTVVKHLAVPCDAPCRAVSWYHSSEGTKHRSRRIELCERPSSNCFIVSEWDESRRGFLSMSTFCHFTKRKTSPPPSAASASACIKRHNGPQRQALFSTRRKQARSQTQTLFIRSLASSIFLLPPSGSPKLPPSLRSHCTDGIVSLLMFVLWSRISKQSINLRWALRRRRWQLRVSCYSYAHACCMTPAFFVDVHFWSLSFMCTFVILQRITAGKDVTSLFSKTHRPPCHLRTTGFIWRQAWTCCMKRWNVFC